MLYSIERKLGHTKKAEAKLLIALEKVLIKQWTAEDVLRYSKVLYNSFALINYSPFFNFLAYPLEQLLYKFAI